LVRTQIQLTDEQAERLRRLAAERNRSIADLVREGVDQVLERETTGSQSDRMRRAARLFGRFSSGTADLSHRHDHHFADAVDSK
jgi:predicted transcriptional regulator